MKESKFSRRIDIETHPNKACSEGSAIYRAMRPILSKTTVVITVKVGEKVC